MKGPLISIASPTKNEEVALERFLKTLKRQKYKNFEVVVVDGHSTDGTVAVAKRYGARVVSEYGKHKSPANARNIGIEKSEGELIAVLDSDVEVDPEFIQKTVDIYLKDKENFFGTLYYNLVCDDSFLSRIRGAYVRAMVSNLVPIPIFIKARYAKTIGKWDPSIGFGEDRLYEAQIKEYLKSHRKLKVYRVNNVIKLHVTHTVNELLSQQRWYGRTIPFYLEKTKNKKDYLTLIKVGYVLLPFSFFYLPILIVSLPFWALTLYHTVKALAKGLVHGFYIPFLDVIMGFGFLVGLIEHVFRKARGRD
jgi:glycosyltransferase involved in cell wall biosynthesis